MHSMHSGCKPFLTCLLLEHSLEMHHYIKCLHFLKLLMKLKVHGCKHKTCYIHRFIQMIIISTPFGSWGIVSRRFIRDFIIKNIHLPLLFKDNLEILRPIKEVCPIKFFLFKDRSQGKC